jgi:hypothetical protein
LICLPHQLEVHHRQTATLRRNVVELDEVHSFASPMPCDLKQIAYAREAALAGETRRDLLERDRDDGIDFDLAFLELVSPADTNVRTHPDANASRDRTTSHAIAQVLREQHRASLARCSPVQRGLAAFARPNDLSLSRERHSLSSRITPVRLRRS